MANIVGTDGIAPTFNPTARWTIWELSEVYVGGIGNNMYVPKINDYVVDAPSATFYIVTDLNLANYIPVLQQIEPAALPPILKYQNTLVNPSIPDVVNPYRLYFNSNTSPYTINVDSSLIILNTVANSVKLIYGTNVITNPQVLSVSLDNEGNIVSDSIPLVGISFNETANVYNKSIPTAYTNQLLQDGDIVTVLVYDAAGQVISKQALTVVVTDGYIGQSNPVKLISGLTLESPYISNTQPNTITLPSNIGISSVNLLGVVQYNDGTSVTHNVNDGGPFKVYGLDQVLKSNMLGSVPIVLQYSLQPEESAVTSQSYNGKTVSENFTLELVSPNYDYQFQIYPIPVWNGTAFVTKWFLLSMSRNVFNEVTDLVTYSNGTGFNGSLFNTPQPLEVSLNLGSVNPAFNGLNVNQFSEINFSNPAIGPSTIYQISTNTAVSTSPYGANLRAKSLNTSNNILDITCQYTQVSDWLNALYFANDPVTNPQLETTPPTPTHFDIFYNPNNITSANLISGGMFKRFQLGQWNCKVQPTTQILPLNGTIMIRFLLISSNQVSILSVSPLLITRY